MLLYLTQLHLVKVIKKRIVYSLRKIYQLLQIFKNYTKYLGVKKSSYMKKAGLADFCLMYLVTNSSSTTLTTVRDTVNCSGKNYPILQDTPNYTDLQKFIDVG